MPQPRRFVRTHHLVVHAEVLIAADAVGERTGIESSLAEAAGLAQRMGTLGLQATVCTERAERAS